MRTRGPLSLLVVFVILTAWACSPDEQTKLDEATSGTELLVDWMTGYYSSEDQAAADSDYYDVRLHMVPIWEERSDAHWIYVEQAVADYLHRPYRQRVYRVSQLDDTTFISEVYAHPEPLKFAGAWRDSIPLAHLTPDSFLRREGCTIYLHRDSSGAFVGSTRGNGCESTLRGAAYATSEVRITAESLYSWDRGYDSTGAQAWGAEKGGYLFIRKMTFEELRANPEHLAEGVNGEE